MNYALQVVRGRAGTSTIKLIDGVNSIGRHDDCLIRIRSSQVSRRHCEVFEDGGTLLLRDLGSSNGTFVNGKRVLGQQRLAPGDEITVGGVTLRVERLNTAAQPAAAAPGGRPSDTAELQAIPDDEDEAAIPPVEDEFEVALEDDTEHLDLIPLDDEPPPPKPAPKAKSATAKPASGAASPAKENTNSTAPSPASNAEEDAAVAQFLMDLKLDEED